MPRSSVAKGLVSTFTVLAVAACSSDSPTTPSTSLDLNAAISSMAAGNATSYAGASALLPMPTMGASVALVPNSCSYSVSAQAFTCPARTVNGITITGSYYLLDGSGNPLSVADPTKTASIRTVTDAQGTITFSNSMRDMNGSMSLTQHADMTLSGLLGTSRALNGTSTAHMDATFTSPMPMHEITDMTTTTTNLVLPASNATSHYPTSGSIEVDMSMSDGSGSTPETFKEVMTFNGTSTVTMTFTSSFGTQTCTFDLSGSATPMCS